MNALRTLRKLVLGETWTVPLGVAAVLLVAGAADAAGAPAWRAGGGFLVLAGVLVVLVLAVARSARPRRGFALPRAATRRSMSGDGPAFFP